MLIIVFKKIKHLETKLAIIDSIVSKKIYVNENLDVIGNIRSTNFSVEDDILTLSDNDSSVVTISSKGIGIGGLTSQLVYITTEGVFYQVTPNDPITVGFYWDELFINNHNHDNRIKSNK